MHSAPDSGRANRLADETSPYLQQHAHNPVDWHPWNEQALTLARQANRPILLSIGYSACHWCHVMAHESFEDEGVAAVMNELFVNIKVDREERPDLDQIYQTAHQMLTQRAGGWPLTMFLTPDGMPFYGGTYFPREPRYGLPGFADLCRRVAEAYAAKRGEIAEQNRDMRRALADTVPPGLTFAGEFDARPFAAFAAGLARNFDRVNGGFGGAPKFPHPTDLAVLLQSTDPAAREMALTTLARMAEGGIYDQLGGGFCRYSVDAQWEIPHFEKMLYDNGPLLALCADAWAQSGDALFRRVVEETAAWTLREMQDHAPGRGGYYSSLDADSEGEEGRYYVWDRKDVRALLTPEQWEVAAPHWGLDSTPNFEGHWHLKVAAPLDETQRHLLAAARDTLFAARERRIRPGRDEKILTSWNALMIAGMAHAARVFDRADWLDSSRAAADFLRHVHWRDGRLLATSRDGRAHLAAYLDDHALLLAALLELLQAGYRAEDLAFARDLADALLDHFEDREGGGFFFTAHDHEALILRAKSGYDNATPAGNGVAAWALQRLGHLLGEARYLTAAERTLRLFWPHLSRSPGGYASTLQALAEHLAPPTVIILRGPADECADWQRQLGANPTRMVLGLPVDLAGLPVVLDKPPSARVNAWVCRGVNCLSPIADGAELRQVLSAL